LISDIAGRNANFKYHVERLVRLPISAFETAFFGHPALDVSTALVDAVNEYLSSAHLVNSLIDQYFATIAMRPPGTESGASDRMRRLQVCWQKLPGTLKRLDTLLERELEAQTKSRQGEAGDVGVEENFCDIAETGA